jgi:hypothetical protein
MTYRVIHGCFESLPSAIEHPIRSLTPRAFASEVFYVALASAKGRPRRSCLDDLSRHSRLLPIVVICDRAFDLKHAHATENQHDVLSIFYCFSTAIRNVASNNLCSDISASVRVHNPRCIVLLKSSAMMIRMRRDGGGTARLALSVGSASRPVRMLIATVFLAS